LAQALDQEPDNPFAARNLAGVLGNRGKYAQALPLFRRLAAAAPDDPALRLALAGCLEALDAEYRAEASRIYKEVKAAFPNTALENAAVAGLNRLANEDLHGAVDDRPRPDVIMYMQAAMDRFAKLPRQDVGQVVMEIAQLGQPGLSINDRCDCRAFQGAQTAALA
jgi:predicted Zn-dependent protease